MTDETTEQFDDNTLEQVLTSMSRSFQQSDDREFGNFYNAYFPSHSESSEEMIPTPREFNSAFSRESRLKSYLAREVVSKLGVPKETEWKAVYIYENYSFVKRFIAALVSKFEGGACSVDKTSWLLSYYVKIQKASSADNALPISEQQWNAPQIGSIPLWIAVLDELPYFQSGKYEKLFTFLSLLENHYALDQEK